MPQLRPAKRRRHNNVQLPQSDSDEPDSTARSKTNTAMDNISSPPVPVPVKKTSVPSRSQITSTTSSSSSQPRAKTANFPSNAAPIYLPKQRRARSGTLSASASPEKSKKKTIIDESGRNGNISLLFSKQAQRQKDAPTDIANPKPSSFRASQDITINDLDDISDDDNVFQSIAQTSSLIGQAARKRARGSQAFKNEETELPSSTQRFVVNSQASTKVTKEEDTRPWAERFAPKNLEELAVHKRKVADVRAWLENVTNGQIRQRVLLLKGAAGTGKTTTVQLLADELNVEVLEWRNPVGSVDTSDGFQSMTAQFEEFLGRSGKFGQLDIFSTDEAIPSKPEPKPLDRRKRLILVEEFPNTFTRSSGALQSFRSTILQYLAANMPPLSMGFGAHTKDNITPLVLIVSETLLTTTSSSADSFTAHRLLGPEILKHPGVGIFEFNPIAPTLLAKALEVIVQKESRKSGRRTTPGPIVLKALGEVGDIRSAIGSLEFLCLRGDVDGDWGAKVAFGKAKRGKEQALTKMEEESLELVTRREASLGIFHAVARVVYNKREAAPTASPVGGDVEKLPHFLSSYARPKRSEVDVQKLIDETGTDTQTFIAALHENYILSCDAPPTSFEVSSLDHVNGCIEALSDSDLLCPSWDGSFNSTGFGGGTGGRGSGGDILRQDEITFQIAVRGLLFALPNPVTRKPPTSGGLRKLRGGDQFKMFYPTSLRLWRTQEDIESTLDHWVTRLMKGEHQHLHSVTSGAAAFVKPKSGTVESWKSASATKVSTSKAETDVAPLIAIGTAARKEMLLERLPYMLMIAKTRRSTTSALAIKELEKVVTFHGIGPSQDDEAEGDEKDETAVVGGEAWATDKPTEGTSPRKKPLVMRGKSQGTGLAIPVEQEMKLVLSDDDIEDD